MCMPHACYEEGVNLYAQTRKELEAEHACVTFHLYLKSLTSTCICAYALNGDKNTHQGFCRIPLGRSFPTCVYRKGQEPGL